MPIATGAELLNLLRQCRVLEDHQLHEVETQLAQRLADPRALARELVQRGWLTPLQVNELFLDRGPRLLLGSYVLMEKLGEGGMGAVYKARNWKLGQIVAVKIIRKERLTNTTAVRRFEREIRAAARLNHPHIVRALDADEIDGTHLLVMEFVDGIDLHKLVKSQGPLPMPAACDYIRQAALGLQHALEQSFVHRDIKPHNLLVSFSGEPKATGIVKILDMGLALFESPLDEKSSTMTQEGTVMGTPDYMAPEQSRDAHQVDIRADLYSLGCTLYYLLTGRPPFLGGTFAEKLLMHQFDQPALVNRWRPGVPRELTILVAKLLSKRAEDRCQTPLELSQILAAMHERLPDATSETKESIRTEVAAKPAVAFPSLDTSLPAVKEFRQRQTQAKLPKSWLISGGAILAVILLALLGWGLSGGKKPNDPDSGDRKQARRKPKIEVPPDIEPDKKPPEVLTRPGPAGDDWIKAVRTLDAREQASAVFAKLKELNEGFDVTKVGPPDIQGDKVVGITFNQTITDISPVRALASLEKLTARAEQYAHYNPHPIISVADLSPLKGLPLRHLDLGGHRLGDLTPLAGMPLEHLSIYHSLVHDLSPLAKCRQLTLLDISGTMVRDLGPLKGLPLKTLLAVNTFVEDLSPLSGMPLELLSLRFTGVSDLAPLRGMKSLTDLRLDGTRVTDLSPLKGMRFQRLQVEGTPSLPLSQLADNDIRATYLECSIRNDDDVTALERLPHQPLTINDLNTLQNRKIMRPGPEHQAFIKQAAKLPPQARIDAVCARLGKLNGVVPIATFEEQNNEIVSLTIVGPKVKPDDPKAYRLTDLTPLEAMPKLRVLEINKGEAPLEIRNLWPLRKLPLEKLHIPAEVIDLSPLAGMPLRSLLPYPGVGSLTPLANCPLESIDVGVATHGVDIGPLRNLALRSASLPTYIVKDLEALRDAPLKSIRLHYVEPRHRKALKAMKQLEKINGKNVAEFWQDIAQQQLTFVRRELKRLNPGFAGKMEHSLIGGDVHTVTLSDTEMADLSPLAHLKTLKVLNIGPSKYGDKGKVADLTPLAGLPLTHLQVHYCPLKDLSPAAKMPLESLQLIFTEVKDISCLRGKPMHEVNVTGSPVADLEPLRNMNLATFAGDRARIVDYRVLAGMPLRSVSLDYNQYRDAEWLRKMISLRTINALPAAEFWKKVDARQAEFDAWSAKVAKLSAKEQVQAVADELKRRNPNFDGKFESDGRSGSIVSFAFNAESVTDISPVRALTGLLSLNCSGPARGSKLQDLWPLRGMPLTHLSCSRTDVTDLGAIAGSQLKHLDVNGTKVADLTPLRGLPLEGLVLYNTSVRDLTPLKGMKLKSLDLAVAKVEDLSPLFGMKLTNLRVSGNEQDLAPLKGMPLTSLAGVGYRIRDLSPLADMPLQGLDGTFVQAMDLSPLRTLSDLKWIQFDFVPWRHSELLRSLPKLEKVTARAGNTLRDVPLADVRNWADWEDAVRASPPEKQLEMFKAKLIELNGKDSRMDVGGQIDKDTKVVTELFCYGETRDVSPVRAFPAAHTLSLGLHDHSNVKSPLTDLTPLRGLKLKKLSLMGAAATDLTPLRGMPLEWLSLRSVPVVDLAPLLGMPLKELNCSYTHVKSLEPLRQSKLETLACAMNPGLKSLAGLERLPLKSLDFWNTGVTSLEPVRNCPLESLNFGYGGSVGDLTPLKGMRTLKVLHNSAGACYDISPLTGLDLEDVALPPTARDLFPLKDMPIRKLACTFRPWRDFEVLQSLTMLESINPDGAKYIPAAAFRKKVETERADFDAWLEKMRRLPPEGRFKQVKTKMLEANPKLGADWNARYTMKNGVIDDFIFHGAVYAELAPLRAFAEMPILRLGRGEGFPPFHNRSTLVDLSPLRGLKIGHLSLHNTEVSDLRPLEGMPLESIRLTGTRVTDLSPLLKSPLKNINCDYVPQRDAPILRQIKSLQTINGKKAAFDP